MYMAEEKETAEIRWKTEAVYDAGKSDVILRIKGGTGFVLQEMR